MGGISPEAMDEGHCGLPLARLVLMAVKLLDAPAEIVETRVTIAWAFLGA